LRPRADAAWQWTQMVTTKKSFSRIIGGFREKLAVTTVNFSRKFNRKIVENLKFPITRYVFFPLRWTTRTRPAVRSAPIVRSKLDGATETTVRA